VIFPLVQAEGGGTIQFFEENQPIRGTLPIRNNLSGIRHLHQTSKHILAEISVRVMPLAICDNVQLFTSWTVPVRKFYGSMAARGKPTA